MKRREVYGTSGTRMTVRFFAGHAFTAADARSRVPADAGYAKGVPMGGDLSAAPAGKVREKVHDVVWSGGRRPGADGRLPPVGDTVDVATATWTDTIGAPELSAVWEDPGFRAGERAWTSPIWYAPG